MKMIGQEEEKREKTSDDMPFACRVAAVVAPGCRKFNCFIPFFLSVIMHLHVGHILKNHFVYF